MKLRNFLIDKKIDPEQFELSEPERYRSFNIQFAQMHPGSFTAQKLFLINKLRRKYKLDKEPEEKVATKPKVLKPKFIKK